MAYCLFVARVVTFAPERSEGASVTTRATNKQYDPAKVVSLSLTPIYKNNYNNMIMELWNYGIIYLLGLLVVTRV